MYNGLPASSLLDVTKRLIKAQSFSHYENDVVENVIEGFYTLESQVEQTPGVEKETTPSLGNQNSENNPIRAIFSSSQSISANRLVPCIIQNHDVNVLRLYNMQRLEKIRTASIQDIPYSEEEWLNLSEEEKRFHRDYMDLLRALKMEYPPEINLSASLIPPREAIVVVRVLQDI
ncbi:1885_t:CDS:1, partial [Acaulospora colombiana]